MENWAQIRADQDKVVIDKLLEIIQRQNTLLQFTHDALKSMWNQMDDEEVQETYVMKVQALDRAVNAMNELIKELLLKKTKGPKDV